MTRELTRELGRIRRCDFMIEDHGLPFLDCDFEYEGSGQGIGRVMTIGFMMNFLRAVGVDSLRACVGKSVWVTHDHNGIYKVEPLHKKDGTAFDFEEYNKAGKFCDKCNSWVEDKEKR